VLCQWTQSLGQTSFSRSHAYERHDAGAVERDAGDLDGRWRTAITMTVAGTLALAVTFAGGGRHWPQVVAGWLALAVLCLMYGVAFILLVTLLPRWGVVGNSPVLNIEPVAALLLAWWLLDQRLSPMQLIGVAVVISGVLALALRARPRKPGATGALPDEDSQAALARAHAIQNTHVSFVSSPVN